MKKTKSVDGYSVHTSRIGVSTSLTSGLSGTPHPPRSALRSRRLRTRSRERGRGRCLVTRTSVVYFVGSFTSCRLVRDVNTYSVERSSTGLS